MRSNQKQIDRINNELMEVNEAISFIHQLMYAIDGVNIAKEEEKNAIYKLEMKLIERRWHLDKNLDYEIFKEVL